MADFIESERAIYGEKEQQKNEPESYLPIVRPIFAERATKARTMSPTHSTAYSTMTVNLPGAEAYIIRYARKMLTLTNPIPRHGPLLSLTNLSRCGNLLSVWGISLTT